MDTQYYTTIGLEIHAELSTLTKMFCRCKNDPDEERPNVNICPVCMAHPGAIPTMNKDAIRSVIRVGQAVDGDIADFTEFDRKNYFYPDIPKGYQISQYKYPIVSGGELAGVKITRIHLEEDTGTSKHDKGDYSLVDFNRAGVPLMELVTEPVIHSSKEAGNFARELQLVLRALGVSEANMEKGEMRVELNISISPDPAKFGTKVEVKNINSFRAVERAAEYEIKRMSELLDAGRGSEIVQETRGWNEGKQITFSQRAKENSQDYRYFPDPDLPKLILSEAFDLPALRAELPELPEAKRARYREQFGIKDEDVEIYVNNPNLANFFEKATKGFLEDVIFKDDKKRLCQLTSNFLLTDLFQVFEKNGYPDEANQFHYYFGGLMVAFKNSEISSNNVTTEIKDTVSKILKNVNLEYWQPIPEEKLWKPIPDYNNLVVKQTRSIIERKNIIQQNDTGAIKEIAEKVIAANPKAIEDYKGGKENALMSLVGQIMKETKGSANPAVAKQILLDLLK